MSGGSKVLTHEHITRQLQQLRTYKELAPMLQEVAVDNKTVIQAVTQAIKQILISDKPADEKLMAARLAKDCFERGSLLFIEGFITGLLPSYMQLAGELEANCSLEDLAELTGRVQLHPNSNTNLYVMLVESLRNWAEWTKPLAGCRPLANAVNQLRQKGCKGLDASKFFSEWSRKWFEEKLKKLPPTVFESTFKGVKRPAQEQILPAPAQQPKPASASTQVSIKQRVESILSSLRGTTDFNRERLAAVFHAHQEELDNALDDYIQKSANFDETFVNSCYKMFEAEKLKLLGKVPRLQVASRKPEAPPPASQKQAFEQLPEQVDFHGQSDSQQSSELHDSKKFTKSRTKRQLNIIVEEELEHHDESGFKRLIQHLAKQKELLADDNADLERRLNELMNHPTLQIENTLTTELMETKRKKFLLGQKIEELKRKSEAMADKEALVRSQPLIQHQREVKSDTPIAEFNNSNSRLRMPPAASIDKHSHVLTRQLTNLMAADNITRFKLVVLGTSNQLLRLPNILVTVNSRLETKHGSDLKSLSVQILVPKGVDVAIKYQNPQGSLDLWSKPLVSLDTDSAITQDLTLRLMKPPQLLAIGYATSNTLLPFQLALPVLFLCFLRNGQVSESSFSAAFRSDKASVVESGSLPRNMQLLPDPAVVRKYFENAIVAKEQNRAVANLAFLLSSQQKIFLVQLVFASSQLNILVMELESQGRRNLSDQLLSDLTFLFTN